MFFSYTTQFLDFLKKSECFSTPPPSEAEMFENRLIRIQVMMSPIIELLNYIVKTFLEEWQQQISHFIIGSLNVPSASNSYLIEWKNHLKMWENVVTPYLYMYSTASPNSYLERKENLTPFFRIRWFDRVRLPIDSIFPMGGMGSFFIIIF